MASLSRDKSGGKRILFIDADGKRRAIRLGKVSVRAAESGLRHGVLGREWVSCTAPSAAPHRCATGSGDGASHV